MRRKDLAVADKAQIEAILAKTSVCHLGLCLDNVPYVVPMLYGYEQNRLYLHAAKEGHKLDILRANPNVCFEMDCDHEVVIGPRACECSIKYRSVIGFGKGAIVEDAAEKKHGLAVLMRHAGAGEYEFTDRHADTVAVIRIDIESMTGKTRYKEGA